MYFVLCDIVMFIALIILSIIGQKGQTPLQAAEQLLYNDWRDFHGKTRPRIISYLKELNENV